MKGFLKGLGIIAAFLALMVVTMVLAYQAIYGPRIPLGVKVLDMDLGGLRQDEAKETLEASFSAYSKGVLPLNYQGQQYKFTPAELGVRFDVNKTLEGAFSVGKSGLPWDRLKVQTEALREGKVLPIVFHVDQDAQRKTLDGLARKVDRAPVNASLKIVSLRVETTSAQGGLQVDRQQTAMLLRERFSTLSLQSFDLPMQALPPTLVEADLADTKAKAQQMISAPVTVKYTDRSWIWQGGPVAKVLERTWELKPDAIATMMRFGEEKGTDNKPRPMVFLDEEAVKTYGKDLAKKIDQPARDARFEWKEGKLSPLVLSQEGRQVEVDKVRERLLNALTSDKRVLELPVATQKPKVALEDVAKMGIVEQIEERSTYYGGSIPERKTNVERGAQLLQGIVVAPGETFSFNQTIGEVSFENGFALGFAASAEGTFPDAGGGLCQVSVTLFHAIFWGGYHVVERYYHPYRIRRYEEPLLGIEATIYAPTLDLKFQNDSSTYLLVQARTDGQRLYVAFYGTKPKWTVKVEGPFISNVRPADPRVIVETTNLLAKGREIWVEKAEDGMDVMIRRIVVEPGKQTRTAEFVSKYRPQQNLKLVGTGPG